MLCVLHTKLQLLLLPSCLARAQARWLFGIGFGFGSFGGLQTGRNRTRCRSVAVAVAAAAAVAGSAAMLPPGSACNHATASHPPVCANVVCHPVKPTFWVLHVRFFSAPTTATVAAAAAAAALPTARLVCN